MRTTWAITLLIIGLLSAVPDAARSEPARLALLIGNQNYKDGVGPLKNPANDIRIVGKALGEVGFETAKAVRDGSREDILFAVHDLAARLRRAGRGAIGFVYYTGHGISVGGDNVLVPINVESTSDAELSIRGVKVTEVLDILQRDAPDAVHFVVLDACRNNIRGQRGAKGFVPVSDQRTGVVLAFAAAAGQTASDTGATSGPYAAALAEELVKPGLTDQAVFNAVRSRVVEATNAQQTPWTHDGLIGERVVFKPVQSPGSPALAAPPPAVDSTDVVRLCREVEQMSTVSVLEAIEKQQSNATAIACIQARIRDLQARSAPAAVKPPSAVTEEAPPAPKVRPQPSHAQPPSHVQPSPSQPARSDRGDTCRKWKSCASNIQALHGFNAGRYLQESCGRAPIGCD